MSQCSTNKYTDEPNGCKFINVNRDEGPEKAIFRWFSRCGGWAGPFGYEPMMWPIDLVIITTDIAVNMMIFEGVLAKFLLSTESKHNTLNKHVNIRVDSWNHIYDYTNVKNHYFIFDKQVYVNFRQYREPFMDIIENNECLVMVEE